MMMIIIIIRLEQLETIQKENQKIKMTIFLVQFIQKREKARKEKRRVWKKIKMEREKEIKMKTISV